MKHEDTSLKSTANILLRFQGLAPDQNSGSKRGIFQLVYRLREWDKLPEYALTELNQNLGWLAMHLQEPQVLKENDNRRAISWFRSSAHAPLKRIWAVKSILDDQGFIVELVKTDDPGTIIYEDGWQVVAKPFRGKRKA